MSANTQIGTLSSVEIYNTRVLGMVKWLYTGAQRRLFDISEFRDDVDVYEFGGVEAGAIYLRGLYDPSDITGQAILSQLFEDHAWLPPGEMKLYVGENNYFTVDSDGRMQITLCNHIESDRNKAALIELGMMVSGGFLIRMTRNPLQWDEFILWQPGIGWDDRNYSYA